MPADGLASSNVAWYDIGVPDIWTVSMDNVAYMYLHQFWITDPIPLYTYIAIFSFQTFGTWEYLDNFLSIMGPQPKYMTQQAFYQVLVMCFTQHITKMICFVSTTLAITRTIISAMMSEMKCFIFVYHWNCVGIISCNQRHQLTFPTSLLELSSIYF